MQTFEYKVSEIPQVWNFFARYGLSKLDHMESTQIHYNIVLWPCLFYSIFFILATSPVRKHDGIGISFMICLLKSFNHIVSSSLVVELDKTQTIRIPLFQLSNTSKDYN